MIFFNLPQRLFYTMCYFIETCNTALKIHDVRLTSAVTIVPGAEHEKLISSLD